MEGRRIILQYDIQTKTSSIAGEEQIFEMRIDCEKNSQLRNDIRQKTLDHLMPGRGGSFRHTRRQADTKGGNRSRRRNGMKKMDE